MNRGFLWGLIVVELALVIAVLSLGQISDARAIERNHFRMERPGGPAEWDAKGWTKRGAWEPR